MTRVKVCPRCRSPRPLNEVLCLNEVDDVACGWDMVLVRATRLDETPEVDQVPEQAGSGAPVTQTLCPDGHVVDEYDILCPKCGQSVGPPGQADTAGGDPVVEERILTDWIVVRDAPHVAGAQRRVVVRNADNDLVAVVTFFRDGTEPDPDVYGVLKNVDVDHVAKVFETGRQADQAYEISEFIAGSTLGEFPVRPDDQATVERIVDEIARALHDLHSVGLRHRDLTPDSITIRTEDPLDLVMQGFGSACLSEFDLDVVSPLETSLYMAPEAVAGGVTAASDWWSLGMILLRKLSPGTFEGINEKAFLIQALTAGVRIPPEMPHRFGPLLAGLLVRNREDRFGYTEVQAWLNGEDVSAPVSEFHEQLPAGVTIELGDRTIGHVTQYALQAAGLEYWEDAKAHLLSGELITWAAEAGLDSRALAQLRTVVRRDIDEDLKLGIALKILNPDMPLVHTGEIVNPGWLLADPDAGYRLVMEDASRLLDDFEMEPWIGSLRDRADSSVSRARSHQIDLDQEMFRINLLSTSRSRLLALWEERRAHFPDSDHPGLASIIDRRQRTEEDLIILLSADIGLFRSLTDVLESALAEAEKVGLSAGSVDVFSTLLKEKSRRELFQAVAERVADFARCEIEQINAWADQFRLERRTSVDRALVILAVPEEEWKQPEDQVYVSQILQHYAARVELQIRRGPLSRMRIGTSSSLIDAVELDPDSDLPHSIVNRVVDRSGTAVDIATRRVVEEPSFASRIRRLVNRASLFKRDTGIDGLYMGFPFAVFRTRSRITRPRIAPILLWPVKLTAEVGGARFRVSFDVDRDEVRLNPALEGYLGPEETARWSEAADELLATSVTVESAMAELGRFGNPMGDTLARLPPDTVEPQAGEVRIYSSAVFFLVRFMGQEVIENLRHLSQIPPTGTALETLLRLRTGTEAGEMGTTSEDENYFVSASDPSQEAAVVAARQPPGIVLSGPPGTGKSQSLVNIVSDCLGRGESILICCAKQAALDVVQKRIETERLGDRVMMVTDVNRDRRNVLETVRSLLETVAERDSRYDRLLVERSETAARIKMQEDELNACHTALYSQIGSTGRTYRDVIAELVVIEDAAGPGLIDVPGIRPILAKRDLLQLAELEEQTGSLASNWLKARSAGSRNHALKQVSWDTTVCGRYRSDLDRLRSLEDERANLILSSEVCFDIDDLPAAEQISSEILDAYPDAEAAARLQGCVDWFTSSPDCRGRQCLRDLDEVLQTLCQCEGDRVSDRFSNYLAREKKALLVYLRDQALIALNPSILRFINPQWYLTRSRLKRFITRHTDQFAPPLISELRDACELELEIRDCRRQLASISQAANHHVEVNRLNVQSLVALTQTLTAQLQAIERFSAVTAGCPGREFLMHRLHEGGIAPVRQYRDALNHSIQVQKQTQHVLTRLASMETWWDEATMDEVARSIHQRENIREPLASFASDAEHAEEFLLFRRRLEDATPQTAEVLQQLESVRTHIERLDRNAVDDAVRAIVAREARLAWRQMAEEASPVLVSRENDTAARVDTLSNLDRDMKECNRRLLSRSVVRNEIGTAAQWADITRYTGRRARRLREFMDQGTERGLLKLFPVWMMNPSVAAQLLPLKRGMFDVVVFDESSQLPIEFALHVLARAKRVVVAGDEKQMPPSGFFQKQQESEDDDLESEMREAGASDSELEALERRANRRDITQCDSLLKLAKLALPRHKLQIHYRSRFRELIEFSNAAFYLNDLHIPVRHPESLVRTRRPIEVVQVDGCYRNRQNESEAKAIVERLAEIWRAAEYRPSVGVITFNTVQSDLINSVVEERAECDVEFRKALARESARVEHGEDMAFFVMSVENCQGVERDVILFSTTFGRNEQGSFRRGFGVLGENAKSRGKRRLNVAVTRARQKNVFFNSMPIREISDFLIGQHSPNTARDHLQAYLDYARRISGGELESAKRLLRQISQTGTSQAARAVQPDGFGRIVETFLREMGYTPVSQRDGSVFSVDYALEHPDTGQFFLGIECDAPGHPLLIKPRYREIWRPSVLQMGIPRIHRVSSVNWYTDREREQTLLRKAIDQACAKENER